MYSLNCDLDGTFPTTVLNATPWMEVIYTDQYIHCLANVYG